MESFVYVVLYHVLRYFPHNELAHTMRIRMKNIFQYRETQEDGTSVGGQIKKVLFKGKSYLGVNFHFDSVPLDEWRYLAFDAVNEWIEHVDPPRGVISKGRWDKGCRGGLGYSADADCSISHETSS